MTAFERKIPPQPAELPAARDALRSWLRDVGVEGEDATADVLIVTSELVTNGVLHDGGDLITLRADHQEAEVSIEVTTVDHPPGQHPTYRDVEASADGGRGLEIVQALSHDYRVVHHDHERVTECQVTTGDDDAASIALADVGPAAPSADSIRTSGPQPRRSLNGDDPAVATIDDAEHTARPARAAAEEAAVKATDEDKVMAEGRAQMRDNLKRAGYG